MYEGCRAYLLAERLLPIYRSISGDGVRTTLRIIRDHIGNDNFNIIEIPSHTKCFDWTVPQEWKINDAFIEDENRRKIISFSDNFLHVVGYSYPVDKWVDHKELNKWIITQADQPNVIPYVTAYYKKTSAFCMSYNMYRNLSSGKYHLYIDSELYDGSMSIGELIIPGDTKDEVFISTYSCHPAMANDNCSSLGMTAELARYICEIKSRRYTYRFVFAPETIGAIAYLSLGNHLEYMKKHVTAGFVFSCVGDDGDYSIIHSRYNNTLSENVLQNVLMHNVEKNRIKEYSFLERGSDERQYNSPGVDLGVVGFCRTKYWEFPEYHTSADNLEVISEEGLQGSFDVMKKVVDALEGNRIYKATYMCEPQLSKRNLYPSISQKGIYDDVKLTTDLLAYADGKQDLIQISNMIDQPIDKVIAVARKLAKEHLLDEVKKRL